MQKILLIGSNGQLGKALKKVLSGKFELHAFDKEDLDITNPEELKKKIEGLKPNLIVNAAAYTAVDLAETEQEAALLINGEAVKNLAQLCEKFGAKLIHFSTDYVFDGENEEGYAEDAETNPINFYGESKLAGEQAIQASGCDFAIIRTSWLYGDGKNFVNTMLELGKNKDEIKVVSDQTGSPTFTKDLAEATHNLICHSHPSCHSGLDPESHEKGEIFHLTNEGTTTWFNFAKKIFELAKLDVKVIPITTAEFPTPAKRPKSSTLLNTKLPKLRNWEEALAEFLKDVRS